jgi:hypothetical protein
MKAQTELLRLGEAAAAHAAKMFVRADAERRAWLGEWERIAGDNQMLREQMRPRFPVRKTA